MHLKSSVQYQERYIKSHYPEEWEIIKNIQGDTWVEKLYRYLHKIDKHPVCGVCGKETKFRNSTDGYSKFCRKCSARSESLREKHKRTCMERYGVPHYTNRTKYKRTCMERYGVSNPNLLTEVREKISETNKKLYGGTGFASSELMKKQHNTMIKKYGVRNVLQKDLQTTYPELIRFNGTEWTCKCPHEWCTKCSEKEYITNQRAHYTRKNNNIELCTKLLPVHKISVEGTSIELYIRNILDTHNIRHIDNSYNIIAPKQIDIYLPDYNIGVECNGIRWHSDKFHSARHCLIKHQYCEDKGIQLLTFWEDQINTKPQIVESVLLSKLGIYKSRYGARQCIIKEINSSDANNFLEANHIQGKTSSKIKLGAFIKDELVGVMTFIQSRGCQGSKIIEDGQWELNRFCTLLNVQIIGLASKMLKYFIRHYNPTSVISFSHGDISNGSVYKNLGFEKNGPVNISYYYIKQNIRYHRSNFTRAGIVRRWPEYDINDKSWTERMVMENKGYSRIYDCGTQKWILRL